MRYEIKTGTNTMGTWAAEVRWIDEYGVGNAKTTKKGVVAGYGFDEAAAVTDGIAKAQAERRAGSAS